MSGPSRLCMNSADNLSGDFTLIAGISAPGKLPGPIFCPDVGSGICTPAGIFDLHEKESKKDKKFKYEENLISVNFDEYIYKL